MPKRIHVSDSKRIGKPGQRERDRRLAWVFWAIGSGTLALLALSISTHGITVTRVVCLVFGLVTTAQGMMYAGGYGPRRVSDD
jgi:hypothetical protein